jgi:hypothetical protein
MIKIHETIFVTNPLESILQIILYGYKLHSLILKKEHKLQVLYSIWKQRTEENIWTYRKRKYGVHGEYHIMINYVIYTSTAHQALSSL